MSQRSLRHLISSTDTEVNYESLVATVATLRKMIRESNENYYNPENRLFVDKYCLLNQIIFGKTIFTYLLLRCRRQNDEMAVFVAMRG